jgi:hypothetical protein
MEHTRIPQQQQIGFWKVQHPCSCFRHNN